MQIMVENDLIIGSKVKLSFAKSFTVTYTKMAAPATHQPWPAKSSNVTCNICTEVNEAIGRMKKMIY